LLIEPGKIIDLSLMPAQDFAIVPSLRRGARAL
jgi:hypothetical protein